LKIQKACLGYEDCIGCEEKNFKKTSEDLMALVKEIQRESLFSPNEEIEDIDPQNLGYLMVPYYQADTLFRFMEDRKTKI